MIVVLDFQIANAELMDHEQLSELFSEVARASLLGDHRFVISRAMSKWAANNLDLSEKHRRHIVKIGQEYAQLGDQASRATFKVLIQNRDGGVQNLGNGSWTIGLRDALSGGYLSSSHLVLENATNDGKFYDLIFRLHAKKVGFGEVSYQAVHGGGNGCSGEIRRLASQKVAVSCICDTDRKTPDGAASATYTSVIAERNRSNPLGILVGTPGREVENFLNPQIVRDLSKQTDAIDTLIDLMEAQPLELASGDCLWLFYDIKNGFRAGALAEYCRSYDSLQWVSRKYKISENSIATFSMPSLGTRILDEFMRSDELKREMHKHVRSAYWATHFRYWMDDILWFLAGRKRERVS